MPKLLMNNEQTTCDFMNSTEYICKAIAHDWGWDIYEFQRIYPDINYELDNFRIDHLAYAGTLTAVTRRSRMYVMKRFDP